ncbi:MAG: exlusion protein FxsA [Methylophaga sp.]|nr:MAG: exlusion protein FxsA [Methylophaga sp.]
MFRALFLVFLIVPLIEIYFLIQVGYAIGAGLTIFAVVATAIIGVGLLRMQGLSTMQRAQLSMAQGQIPATAMLEGIALLFSGAMLLTPGFFTDTIGFILLVPIFRRGLVKQLFNKGQFSFYGQSAYSSHRDTDPTIIEGEVVEHDADKQLK